MPNVAKLAGAVVCALTLWLGVDWGSTGAAIPQADFSLAWAAFTASAASVLISALKWHRLLDRAQVRISLGEVTRLYWTGTFCSNFLPTGVGGDVIRLALTPAPGRL